MSSEALSIAYTAEHTAALFHADDSRVRGIMGPIGSGKSVACCMEILSRAILQKPNAQGVRKTRWGIIRNTYPELRSTTIKTWQEWVPDDICPIVYNSPIAGKMNCMLPDKTILEMEIVFLALDKPKDIKKLLSLELTGGWINEAREIPKGVLDALGGRIGRYPSMNDGGASWSGIIMDTNPPDDDHWWYKIAEEQCPAGWKFFRQPASLLKLENGTYVPNPEAENVRNHVNGFDYWLNQTGAKTAEWIKIYLQGDYGSTSDGRPVFPEYNDSFHCAKEKLLPYPNLPLILGWDFGLTPSCIIMQLSPKGQLRVLDELISENMGIMQFAKDVARPFLFNHYNGMTIVSWGDPAGVQRAQTDEKTCIEMLGTCGIPTSPASTNVFTARREAVAGYLTKVTDGEPGFLLSPTCKILRKGLMGGYMYERVQVSGEERFKDQPCKNRFSHPADALQYGTMGASPNIVTGNQEVKRAVNPYGTSRPASVWA